MTEMKQNPAKIAPTKTVVKVNFDVLNGTAMAIILVKDVENIFFLKIGKNVINFEI